MKWFKHDSGASVDAKLMKVRHKYGMEGYGLYWYMVELIAGNVSSKNITFELEHDAESIAQEWRLDQMRVQEMMLFMVNLELFEESDGRITCLKLAKRLDDTNAKNPQIRAIISARANQRDQALPTNSEKFRETPRKSRQIRLDKNRSDKGERFTPPTLQQVAEYCAERDNTVNPQKFIDHYQANGWMRGKSKVRDWKACVRTWEKEPEDTHRTQELID